LEQTKYRYTHY